MIDGKNSFDQPAKNDMRAYDNNPKFETGQGDDYTAAGLLDYNYIYKDFKW